ncbi:UNVERIFIED_CONTAM: hypothetical protein PYX00_000492 [Menopon gallinae]|uniref:Uncharacterized protein n=1 Tax=Menopon gallinae TaxID=328185 RepID=A0AAW2I9I6_9NEOP
MHKKFDAAMMCYNDMKSIPNQSQEILLISWGERVSSTVWNSPSVGTEENNVKGVFKRKPVAKLCPLPTDEHGIKFYRLNAREMLQGGAELIHGDGERSRMEGSSKR